MITLHYLGTVHGGFGARVIRWAQRGYSEQARSVTHTEMYFGGGPNAATIGSSSLVDDPSGVRIKRDVVLNPAHWRVLDLPDTTEHNTENAYSWFLDHEGMPYDRRGAQGSVAQAIILQSPDSYFCTEAVAESGGFRDPHMFCPAGFYNFQLDMGAVDITDRFFGRAS